MTDNQSMLKAQGPKTGGVRAAIGQWGLVIHWELVIGHSAVHFCAGAFVGTAPGGNGRYSTTLFSGGAL